MRFEAKVEFRIMAVFCILYACLFVSTLTKAFVYLYAFYGLEPKEILIIAKVIRKRCDALFSMYVFYSVYSTNINVSVFVCMITLPKMYQRMQTEKCTW